MGFFFERNEIIFGLKKIEKLCTKKKEGLTFS